MTCVTGSLTPTQLLEEIPEIVKLLETTGVSDLVVEFGSGLSLPLMSSPLMFTMRVNFPTRSKNIARL